MAGCAFRSAASPCIAAGGNSTNTRTCQGWMSYRVPRDVRGGRRSRSFSPFPHGDYAAAKAKQPPGPWLHVQAQSSLHGQPQQPGRPQAAAYGGPQQHQAPMPGPPPTGPPPKTT